MICVSEKEGYKRGSMKLEVRCSKYGVTVTDCLWPGKEKKNWKILILFVEDMYTNILITI